uniref:Uncharacterized protein n=1 Tax=Nannospalax galili TaxID=1026970 RepID=A0A8C6QWP1_NANGA
MVCGVFASSKNTLCTLNMLLGLLLTEVAAWGKGLGLVSSIHIIGGVIAVGVFLLLTAVAGLVGNRNSECQMCEEKFLKHSDEALKILGGVGLFFRFTALQLAMRFRNQKDPRANTLLNPSASP